eukprot:3942001-Rhodomonas_salina.1
MLGLLPPPTTLPLRPPGRSMQPKANAHHDHDGDHDDTRDSWYSTACSERPTGETTLVCAEPDLNAENTSHIRAFLLP